MSVRILANADDTMAALYCSTSGAAFGPVIEDREEKATKRAEAFLASLSKDARCYADGELQALYVDWGRDARCQACEVEYSETQCESCNRLVCLDCLHWTDQPRGPEYDHTRCAGCDGDAENTPDWDDIHEVAR